ncbi:hypothetical protein FA95DRAFT_787697 [Auriscalpium vulgare]|uniref:Uncharacterized protein n=1 Tax=Auriscalpium vulgare TaxID=40419 RepID=A0ACB8RA42_9AGAM|nr:hypothetical protein FA95DRAFT_787697 [Auriscalpium vulgare]
MDRAGERCGPPPLPTTARSPSRTPSSESTHPLRLLKLNVNASTSAPPCLARMAVRLTAAASPPRRRLSSGACPLRARRRQLPAGLQRRASVTLMIRRGNVFGESYLEVRQNCSTSS